MRILITGAAGFIGANLSQKLIGQGHDVFMVDRFSNYYSTEFKLFRVRNLNLLDDIENLNLSEPHVLNSYTKHEIETVIHLAAQPGLRVLYPDNLNYLSDNLNSFNNVISWASRNGVKKFLYASSSSVYEHAKIKPFVELEALAAPSNLYPFTKWVNENVAKSISADSNMEISGLRFFSVYGPYGRPDMAIHRLIEAACTGETFSLNGDGKIDRDFTFIDDVSDRILSLINHRGPLETVYNIGGGSNITINALIQVVEKIVGNKISIELKPSHSADLLSTLANNQRISEVHGSSEWTSIQEGITKTYHWYKEFIKV